MFFGGDTAKPTVFGDFVMVLCFWVFVYIDLGFSLKRSLPNRAEKQFSPARIVAQDDLTFSGNPLFKQWI